MSTNIEYLVLNRTGIKEVPWWIHNFYRLQSLCMTECSELQCVSLNISKHSKEFGDDNVDTERSRKRMRVSIKHVLNKTLYKSYSFCIIEHWIFFFLIFPATQLHVSNISVYVHIKRTVYML